MLSAYGKGESVDRAKPKRIAATITPITSDTLFIGHLTPMLIGRSLLRSA